MITKVMMLDKCKMRLAGGNMTADQMSRYNTPLVESTLAEGYDTLLAEMFSRSRSGLMGLDEFLPDSYTKTFTSQTNPPVVVQFHPHRNEWYADLPKPILSLPYNEGIRLIAPISDQSSAFTIVALGSVPVFSELDVNLLSDTAEAYQEGNRVYFRFPITNFTDLIMKLVVSFDDLDDEDFVD